MAAHGQRRALRRARPAGPRQSGPSRCPRGARASAAAARGDRLAGLGCAAGVAPRSTSGSSSTISRARSRRSPRRRRSASPSCSRSEAIRPTRGGRRVRAQRVPICRAEPGRRGRRPVPAFSRGRFRTTPTAWPRWCESTPPRCRPSSPPRWWSSSGSISASARSQRSRRSPEIRWCTPSVANMAWAMLRELGHGPPIRAVLAIDHVPGADPLRSWLQQALDAPDNTLYDAAEALESGGPQDFVFHGPYGVEYPFGCASRKRAPAPSSRSMWTPTHPGDWLADFVTSAGGCCAQTWASRRQGPTWSASWPQPPPPADPRRSAGPLDLDAPRTALRGCTGARPGSAQIQSDGSTLLLGR